MRSTASRDPTKSLPNTCASWVVHIIEASLIAERISWSPRPVRLSTKLLLEGFRQHASSVLVQQHHAAAHSVRVELDRAPASADDEIREPGHAAVGGAPLKVIDRLRAGVHRGQYPEAQTDALAAAGFERSSPTRNLADSHRRRSAQRPRERIRALAREVLAGRRSVDAAVFAVTAAMIAAPDDDSDPYGAGAQVRADDRRELEPVSDDRTLPTLSDASPVSPASPSVPRAACGRRPRPA